MKINNMPEKRIDKLKELLDSNKKIKVIEAHNALSALIAEEVEYNNSKFDAIWISSLTHSLSKGQRDIEILDKTTLINTILEISRVTSKPIIVDLDTGGQIEHLKYHIQNLEMIGVSAIVIEDKKGFKINSLFENNKNQEQENILEFSKKIKIIKENSITQNLFVIARIESLILDKGLPDALTRARAYVESGADIILIHSKKNKPDEILEFSSLFKKDFPSVPLAVIPTTYNEIYAEELFKNNFDLIIYANQLIRAAYKSMKDVAFEILKNERSFEVEDKLEKIQTIINLLE